MHATALFVTCVLALAAGAPQFPQHALTDLLTTPRPPYIPVLSRNEVRDDDGQVISSYTSADGTSFDQVDVLKPSHDPTKPKVIVQQGTYKYISPDGTPVQVSYIADERGFRPVGTHILGEVPVVPDLPAEPEPVRPRPVTPRHRKPVQEPLLIVPEPFPAQPAVPALPASFPAEPLAQGPFPAEPLAQVPFPAEPLAQAQFPSPPPAPPAPPPAPLPVSFQVQQQAGAPFPVQQQAGSPFPVQQQAGSPFPVQHPVPEPFPVQPEPAPVVPKPGVPLPPGFPFSYVPGSTFNPYLSIPGVNGVPVNAFPSIPSIPGVFPAFPGNPSGTFVPSPTFPMNLIRLY